MKTKIDRHILKQLTLNNYEVLHKHLLLLTWRQQLAIQLRFWEDYSIFQVANTMNISWNEADSLIETAIATLKSGLAKSLIQTPSLQAA